MFKKLKEKLQPGSPSHPSPSPNPRNAGDGSARWETLLNATQTTLSIAKDSVAGLPVPGLEAAIGGLLKVLTIYQGMKANEEAIKAFNAAVVRLNDNVAAPLKEAINSQPDFMDDGLQKRLELLANDLIDLAKRAETMLSREKHKKFFSSQDDLGIIQELNRDLDRIVIAFTGRGSIGAEMEARAAKRLAQTLVIDKLPRAQARHDSASRVGASPCFQGTRDSILQEISAWIDDPNAPPIFWLSGMAGIGKSTIAHTIAEQEDKKHRLGASFFFSRDEADRRNPHLVYPTIAFQLAGFDTSLRGPIAQALEQDADIGLAIMQKQFEHLIAGPLAKLKVPGMTILFVLDALDECRPASGALEILSRCALELPKISDQVGVTFKVLITSRPELHIHDQFNYSSLRLSSQPFVLHDIEKSVVRADIELFLTQRLADLATLHRAEQPWPSVAEVSALASRSDNLFIFASTTVNFIGGVKSGRSLQHRLDRVLKPDPNDATSAFAQLDALYHQVLEDAEYDLEETIPNAEKTFRLVLETIVLLLDPLPSTSLAALLSLQHDDVLTTVQDLRSILVIPADPDSSEPIRFFHPSFYDFITGPGRLSGRFFVTSAEGHACLAKLCLETMQTLLKKDPCSVGSPWLLNSDVADLQMRLNAAAPNHLRYSCRFFSSHISLCARNDETWEQLFNLFCESKLLMWLEMMSLMGDIDGAINSILLLKSWCLNSPSVKPLTTNLVHDAYRILLQYQSPLRSSSGHVYTTVLAFAPACSLTRQYISQLHVHYIIRGQPTQWDANLITTEAENGFVSLAYFPDGKRIATGAYGGQITMWNSSTGAEISFMHEPGADALANQFDVLGDGARIAISAWREGRSSIDIWDATTGVFISRLKDPDGHLFFARLIATSPNGPELLTLSKRSILRRWNSATGEITSTHKLDIKDSVSGTVSRCGSLIAIQDSDFLRIWDLHDDGTLSVTQTLSNKIDPNLRHYTHWAFILDNHRVLSLLSWVTGALVSLWDCGTGRELKTIQLPAFNSVAISNEGKRMALSTRSNDLQIWEIESGTMLGRLVTHTSHIFDLAFSPTEMVVVSISGDSTLRTWDINDILSEGTMPRIDPNRWAGLSASRSGTHVIGTCHATKTVGLWNIPGGNYSEVNLPRLSGPPVMSPDGLYFACKTLGPIEPPAWIIFETKSLRRVYTLPFGLAPDWTSYSPQAVFSEDSQRIAISIAVKKPMDFGSTIKVWDIRQSQMLYEGTLPVSILGLAFLPNGKSLLVVHDDGHLILHFTSSADNVDMVKWQPPRSVHGNYSTVAGVAPDGVHILFIARHRNPSETPRSHLVNMKEPSQMTEYRDSSFVFQFIETETGYEPVFLTQDSMGNLYKRSGSTTKLLCWLPPMWRFSESGDSALWRGSYLIVGLQNGEIGVIDIDALSE